MQEPMGKLVQVEAIAGVKAPKQKHARQDLINP